MSFSRPSTPAVLRQQLGDEPATRERDRGADGQDKQPGLYRCFGRRALRGMRDKMYERTFKVFGEDGGDRRYVGRVRAEGRRVWHYDCGEPLEFKAGLRPVPWTMRAADVLHLLEAFVGSPWARCGSALPSVTFTAVMRPGKEPVATIDAMVAW